MDFCNFKKKNGIVNGNISLPASKSISNRLLLLKALSGIDFEILNLSEAGDTKLMLDLLRKIEEAKGSNTNNEFLVLDCGNAGTVMRFLTAYLCLVPGRWKLTGTPRMQERPIGGLVDALVRGGADIHYTSREGYPPIIIDSVKPAYKGGDLGSIRGNISSQFLSALLMTGPFTEKGVSFQVEGEISSRPYLDMTMGIMAELGITARTGRSGPVPRPGPFTWSTPGIDRPGPVRPPLTWTVESDWTAASYWYELAAFAKEADLFLPGLQRRSLQGDSILPVIYEQLGVSTSFDEEGIRLKNIAHKNRNFSFDFSNNPDLAPTLAVTCAGLNIQARLSGLESLAVKETDRLTALVNELTNLGFKVMANKTELLVIPSCTLAGKPKPVKTYGDHRMAMAFAPLAMIMDGISIENPEVTEKSYPGFWENLKRIWN